MTKQQKAYLYAIAAILCWSTIASAFKLTLRFIDHIQLLFLASVFSTLVLYIILSVQNKTKQLLQTSGRQLLRSALLGFLNPFMYYLVLLKAYTLLKAQEAGTLNYIWPITLVLLSIPLLKQKISWLSILAIVISFTGIVVISTEGQFSTLQFKSPLGVALAVGSSFFWALYWILNLKDKRDDAVKLFLNFGFGSIYVFIVLFLFSDFSFFSSVKGIMGALYVGIFEMGLTYFLWLNALRFSATTAKVSNLVYLSPFISLVIIQLTLKENILLSTVVGLALIVGGIFLQASLDKRSRLSN
jgi:drug/metabolite transporter (DMT)-like permease